MSKPKLRNKKKVSIPSNVDSVTITFRTVRRKGSIKGASKVNVPRTAEQVVVKLNKPATKKPSAKPELTEKQNKDTNEYKELVSRKKIELKNCKIANKELKIKMQNETNPHLKKQISDQITNNTIWQERIIDNMKYWEKQLKKSTQVVVKLNKPATKKPSAKPELTEKQKAVPEKGRKKAAEKLAVPPKSESKTAKQTKIQAKTVNKKQSVSIQTAIKDVITLKKYKDLTPLFAGILYNKFKESDIADYDGEFASKIMEKLEEKKYVIETGKFGKYEYKITNAGKEFRNAVNGRIETLKGIKYGHAMF